VKAEAAAAAAFLDWRSDAHCDRQATCDEVLKALEIWTPHRFPDPP